MNPTCKQCGQCEVEDARACYATPVCFVCLPPPLPLNTAWSLSAVWMADMAEVLEHVRHEDGGPKLLTPETLLELVTELRDERDDWKKRAKAAAYAPAASAASSAHYAAAAAARYASDADDAECAAQVADLIALAAEVAP